jgi:hypothetical protein
MDLILLELLLVLSVALGLGFWQLYDVNKALKEDKKKDKGSDSHPSDHSDGQ